MYKYKSFGIENYDIKEPIDSFPNIMSKEKALEGLNMSLTDIEESPFKLHSFF